MATFEVTIETITVHPHPNADRLEYAQVGLYKSVIPKGVYSTGEEVFYIPEFAVLPDELIKTLGLEGKLSGKAKNRVKPIKLRGLLSQGLVAPLTAFDGEIDRSVRDYSEKLDIHKWEPPVPINLAGDVTPAPELVRWIDIENIKKFPEMFADGELVVIDEKIHGTATCVTVSNLDAGEPNIMVTSKGIGSQSLSLKENDKNAYWQMFHKYDILGFTQFVAQKTGATKVAVFGETYGKIQDLNYGIPGQIGYALFDIHITDATGRGSWVDPELTKEWAAEFGIPQAPVLYEGPYSLEKVMELAYGPEMVSGTEAHIREGVIVRPSLHNSEKEYAGSRKIGKFVSDDYLTRSNGTEFN